MISNSHRDRIELLPYMAAFAVVVDSGSFIDASSVLGITASAVSRQISKLEEALSLRLIERSTRKLEINEDGIKVYFFCKNLLESSSQIFQLKDIWSERPEGTVRLMAPRFLIPSISAIIPEFLDRYPAINLKVFYTDVSDGGIPPGMDLAIHATDKPPEDLIGKRLFDSRNVFCASADYLAKHGNPLAVSDLSNHKFVVSSQFSDDDIWTLKKDEKIEQVKVPVRLFSNDSEALIEAALSGLGIACVPLHWATNLISSGALTEVLDDWKFLNSGFESQPTWLLYPQNKYRSLKQKVSIDYFYEKLRNPTASNG